MNIMMDEMNNIALEEQSERERSVRRKQRMEEMRRRKKQQELVRRLFIPCVAILAVCVLFTARGIGKLVRKSGAQKRAEKQAEAETEIKTGTKASRTQQKAVVNVAGSPAGDDIAEQITVWIADINALPLQTVGGKSDEPPLRATADEGTESFNSEVVSQNGIFIDVEEKRILGQKDAGARINPASMTKILTVLVAAEHITNLDDTFEITIAITDYSYVNDCSNVGFDVGEKVTVRDLFYGTVLPSGGDAALALAIYVSGSQEEFVRLMNQKIDELGLSKTSHFTNCVGLYDANHYSTVYDISVILKAACDNSFCREVLAAHTYTTSITEQHPEGIILSNWFLRRIEDKDTYGEVLCAKTGYVAQSGSCAASLAAGSDGKEYICVTAQSTSSWQCIYDHVELYRQFLPQKSG